MLKGFKEKIHSQQNLAMECEWVDMFALETFSCPNIYNGNNCSSESASDENFSIQSEQIDKAHFRGKTKISREEVRCKQYH